MKRRRLLQSMTAIPVLPAAAAAQYSAPPVRASAELPALAETAPDAVAEGLHRFFNEPQYSALRRLAEIVVPKSGERPGALEAEAPEFLDFLLKVSDAERQLRYRAGLDRLNSEAGRRYRKTFAQLTADEAKPVLEPLTMPWTYAAPSDPFARFLREAKDDLLQATVNSRVYAQSMSRRSRGAAGVNAYWLPLD